MKFSSALKLNHIFRRLYATQGYANGMLVLYARPNRTGKNRVGITTGKKLGHAVVRNRARRRLREVYRLATPHLKKGYDFVLVARSKAVDGSFSAMQENFERLCKKLGVWEEEA